MLPKENLPCIWMSAGLVSYKLCSRDYDCARCPMDQAFGGGGAAATWAGVGAARTPALTHPDFPDDRVYAPGHIWVRQHGGRPGHLALGLDGFALSLCQPLCGLELVPVGTKLGAWAPFARVATAFGEILFHTPAGGHVVAVNERLLADLDPLLDDPYGDGWLLRLDTADGASLRLLSHEDMAARSRLDARRFLRRIGMLLLEQSGDAGPTAPDGGVHLTALHEVLGPSRYLAVVVELLA